MPGTVRSGLRGARSASVKCNAGLSINLKGKKAFVAGVADDQGFGWAIAKVPDHTALHSSHLSIVSFNTIQ